MATERGGLPWNLPLKAGAAAQGASKPAGAQTVVIRASSDGCLSLTRSPKETCLAPNTKDTEEERDRDREGKRQRQTEGERDSENKSAFYSCLLSAYHILDTPLDPGATDILILPAKAQLATFIVVASCHEHLPGACNHTLQVHVTSLRPHDKTATQATLGSGSADLGTWTLEPDHQGSNPPLATY